MEEGLTYIGWMADHGEYDVGGAGSVGWRGNEVGAETAEVLDLGGGAGVHGDGVASSAKAGSHGGAHDTDADPTDPSQTWADRLRISSVPFQFHA